ncbi:MAG: DUF1257 domain-containing protein [Pseudomonadota bacterium]
MSHFTTIATRIVSEEHLVRALEELNIEHEVRRAEIRGYQGIRTEVEIRIPTSNPDYQMGFRKLGDRYELVADWYGIPDVDRDRFVARITQRYAYHAAREKLEEQDFAVVEEEVLADGTIHLTVRRML